MLGSGVIQGLMVTARNALGSLRGQPDRHVTVEYPEQRAEIPTAFRSFPFLVTDGAGPDDGLRCVACTMCESECPAQCIYIVMERDEKGKPTKRPKVFDLDISVCMGCGICVEVCPFDSIKMDKVYEVAATDRFHGLVLGKAQLAKSNAYYRSIRPEEAAEVDARLAEAKRVAEEKAKAAAAKAAAAAAAKAAGNATAA